MLTRLEVHGFKNIQDLTVDFGPFTCVAGENAAGKSNLFDVIELLHLLTEHTLMDAARLLRSTTDHRSGDVRDLFWQRRDGSLTLAVEMIVPRSITDDFEQVGEASITFLRYEIELGLQTAVDQRHTQLVLLSEELRHINLGLAHQRLKFPLDAKQWRDRVLTGRRSGKAFISTEMSGGTPSVMIHQDGGSRGRPNMVFSTHAPRTVVSTVAQINDPTILAARREMQSWRRLALEPEAMRASDAYSDPRTIGSNGAHLASALHRVATTSGEAQDTYSRVAARLQMLTGLRLRSIRVDPDDTRESLTIVLTERNGTEIPARSLSEGTLRFLALCVLLEDPTVTGVLCMEEPENGIHPANIGAMLDVLQEFALDPFEPPGDDNPFRQVIVNTHSPFVVQQIDPKDLLAADSRPVAGVESASALRLRPLSGTWRENGGATVGKADLYPYLTAPEGAQLHFDALSSS